MAKVRTPRQAWIDAASAALASGGPDRVRVESLAAGLGVTKGGFYWHFSDRAALLDAVLDHWERMTTSVLIEQIEAELPAGTDPRRRLRRLFALAPEGEGLGVELAVRDWARRDPGVADRLRAVDDVRLGYLRDGFRPLCSGPAQTEARALLAYSLLFGVYFIAAEHPGRRREDVVRTALRLLLD